MKNCSCPGEGVRTCVRSERATYSTGRRALIVCHTEGLQCSSQNELNRKESRKRQREMTGPEKIK